MNGDPVILHLDLIARALEAMGYAVEVDYTSAIVIVWLDEWPITIEVKRQPERRSNTDETAHEATRRCTKATEDRGGKIACPYGEMTPDLQPSTLNSLCEPS